MKFPIISTIAVTLCALVATAQAEIKVATVNMTELFTLFHKRFDTEDRLKAEQTKIKTELENRTKKLKELVEKDKAVVAKNDPSLSEGARQQLQKQHAGLQNQIQAYQQELRTYAERRELAFREMLKRDMSLLFTELQAKVEEVSSKGGYDLVIDSSAVNARGTKIFPYTKASYDISEEVLKALNADAPEGFDPRAKLKELYGSDVPGMTN